MKQETTNTFNKGLLMDLNPLMTPNNVLTNCLNGTYITFNGNEIMLQNDMGNGKIERAKLPAGYIPIGIKEYGGIIYVVSYNPFTKVGQVGSFPSPEIDFVGSDLENNIVTISDKDFFDQDNHVLTTTISKVCINNQDIIKVGDLYQVSIIDKNTDINNILKIVNDIKNLNSSTNIKDGRKILNIRLAVVGSNNTLNYLTLEHNDPYYEDEVALSNLLGDYILPIVRSWETDLSDYEVYTFGENSKLFVIAELESLDSMDLEIETNSLTEYIYDFKVKIQPHYFWRWLKIDYEEKINGASNLMTKYIRNVYQGENINSTNILLPGVSEALYPDDNNLTSISYSNATMTEDDYITWQLTADDSSAIINYTITPYMCYGPINSLIERGTLNVSRYSETYVQLTKWKYKIVNNKLIIDWGIDYNSRVSQKLYRVDFKFHELTNDADPFTLTSFAGSFENNLPVYDHFLSQDHVSQFDVNIDIERTVITSGITLRTTSSNSVTTFNRTTQKLERNKLYLCEIIYYTIDPNEINPSSLIQDSNAWTRWKTESRFVYTNGVMDSYYDSVSDFSTVSPTVTVNTIPYYKEKTTTSESYTNNSILTYTNSSQYTTEGTRTTKSDIEINAKTIISDHFTARLDNSQLELSVNTLLGRLPGTNIRRVSAPIVKNRQQHTATQTLNANNVIMKFDLLTSTYYDSIFNTKSTFKLTEELLTDAIIDTDSILNSKGFKITSVNKSNYSCDRALDTTTTNKANVLKKYYTEENYPNIFGYDVEVRDSTGLAMPNRLYTDAGVYFAVFEWYRSIRTYYWKDPGRFTRRKTYVKYTNTGTNTISSNWGNLMDVQEYSNTLPSASLFGSKNAFGENTDASINISPDYLMQPSHDLGTPKWCFPLLKSDSSTYAFIYIPKDSTGDIINWNSYLPPHPSITYYVENTFARMFGDKYVFQQTKLSNLYTPSPNSHSYNTYDVVYSANATVLGDLTYEYFKLSDFIVTENSVIDYCNTYSLDIPTNIENVSLNPVFNRTSIEIPFIGKSCQYNDLLETTRDWTSMLNDGLFKLEDGNLVNITSTLDSEGNFYNYNNYYLLRNGVLIKGKGVWKVNIIPNHFTELWIDSNQLAITTRKFPVGKVVTIEGTDDDITLGSNTYWPADSRSKSPYLISRYSGGNLEYISLNASPYNYKIYNEPLNWD